MRGKQRTIIVLLVVCLVVLGAYALSTTSDYSSHDHPILDNVRSNFSILNPDYAKIPLRYGDSAYTENKKVITLCLQDPDSGVYYDMNTIMYVALHELAHVISKSHGHNDEFKMNFAKLLKQGTEAGIYDPSRPIPRSYCGVTS